jgi:hypothetical protein
MKPPTMILKSINGYYFRIRYRQIPYIDRYFFVDIKYPDGYYIKGWQNEIMKIKKLPNDVPHNYMFGFIVLCSQQIKLKEFIRKIDRYDDYLDNQPARRDLIGTTIRNIRKEIK